MNDLALIVILIFCLIYLKYVKYKQFKTTKPIGDYGERMVANKLNQLSEEYIVSNNVHYGKAQIDHLVLCPGNRIAFVIETKIWGGIITGGYRDIKWKQNKNGNIKYYDNPILQNKYHCSQVKRIYPGYRIYNIVVLINDKNGPKYNCMISVNDLVDYIIKTSNNYSNSIPIPIQTDRKS